MHRKRTGKKQRGQAMVEVAIVFPMMIFTVLGIIQLTLVQQAQIMLEYAAFSAARVGAVWNGDTREMEKAAVFALLPTMPSPVTDLLPIYCPKGLRVDDLLSLACRYKVVTTTNDYSPFGNGKRLVTVETLSPTKADFGNEQEIDFDIGGDSLDQRRRSQLTIRLTYFYELRIPIINWVFFESWLAGLAGVGLPGLNPWEPKVAFESEELEIANAAVRMGYEYTKVDSSKTNCSYSGLQKSNLLRLAALGSGLGKWYLPLITTYTIRMQSNHFLKNAGAKPNCK